MNYYIYKEYLSFKEINREKLPSEFWKIILPLVGYIISIILVEFLKIWWLLIASSICFLIFLVVLHFYNKKVKNENKETFKNKKLQRRLLFKNLEDYSIKDEESIISLQNWLKRQIANYEKRVKLLGTFFSTITFSGLFGFLGDVLPSLLEIDTTILQVVFTVVIWIVCLIVVSFLLALGLYSSEYFDYKNMKLFSNELQDILDYNLYEETEEKEQNKNEGDKPQDENVETENKPKPKKCKKKIGRKITIEIVKYDYTGDSSAES